MKKLLFLLFALSVLTSCTTDPDQDRVTTATITLQNTNGVVQSGVTVYAYDEITWIANGDSPSAANFEKTSGADGVVVFNELTSDLRFNALTEFTQNFRFSAHYTLNGTAKTKVISVRFNLGDDKVETIVLD